jgi:hypothetical protein
MVIESCRPQLQTYKHRSILPLPTSTYPAPRKGINNEGSGHTTSVCYTITRFITLPLKIRQIIYKETLFAQQEDLCESAPRQYPNKWCLVRKRSTGYWRPLEWHSIYRTASPSAPAQCYSKFTERETPYSRLTVVLYLALEQFVIARRDASIIKSRGFKHTPLPRTAFVSSKPLEGIHLLVCAAKYPRSASKTRHRTRLRHTAGERRSHPRSSS